MQFRIIGLICLLSVSALAKDWTWSGYEIIGYKTVSRAQIQNMVPISLGSKYTEDAAAWSSICTRIQNAFSFYNTHCSSVRYVDSKAFLIVEVVEQGDQQRVQFRQAPTEDVVLADKTVAALYDKLYARIHDMFAQGIAFRESHDKGYLDFDDAELSETTALLAKAVPPYHDNLIDVLRYEEDSEKRAQAANLLNWARRPSEDILRSVQLLDDPSEAVRNNISRFAQAFIGEVTGAQDRRRLVDSFLVQLMRPSHADRNKALYSLLNLVKAYPPDAAYVKQKGEHDLKLIASQSILYNVRDTAIELLKLLQ